MADEIVKLEIQHIFPPRTGSIGSVVFTFSVPGATDDATIEVPYDNVGTISQGVKQAAELLEQIALSVAAQARAIEA